MPSFNVKTNEPAKVGSTWKAGEVTGNPDRSTKFAPEQSRMVRISVKRGEGRSEVRLNVAAKPARFRDLDKSTSY